MRFDTLIIGGGLTGLVAGISLQKAGRSTAIVSTGQNTLHFFSGSFASLKEAPQPMAELFAEAGIGLHYSPGVRLMPMGTFREAELSLDDVSIFSTSPFARRVLVISFPGYHEFFHPFLVEGLEKQGIYCRVHMLDLPELSRLKPATGEMRSLQLARTLDVAWNKLVQEIRLVLKDEDTVILPQVFGLNDPSVPGRIRQGIPAQVVFVGTFPPSIPGIRTQILLKRRFEVLGGTYLMGDQVMEAHVHDGVVHSVVTRNLDNHYLEADHFVLASGSFFSKGLMSNPMRVYEPVFGLDVAAAEDRNDWYNPEFAADQPYMGFGVLTDASLHPMVDGRPFKNLYAAGSVLGATRPELGTGAGLAVNSALAVADAILQSDSSIR